MEGIENEFSKVVNDCFRCADQGNKGFLTKEDYKVSIIQLFGYKPSKHEVSNIWSETVSTDEGLRLNKFMNIVLPRLSRRDSSDHIRQVFLAFDRFCHGFISQDDCIAAFVKVLPHMPMERIYVFFKEIDSDLDGRVSYRDFEMMMKSYMLP